MQDVPDLGVRNSTLSQRPGRPSSRDDFIARQRETHQKVSNVTCASCRKCHEVKIRQRLLDCSSNLPAVGGKHLRSGKAHSDG